MTDSGKISIYTLRGNIILTMYTLNGDSFLEKYTLIEDMFVVVKPYLIGDSFLQKAYPLMGTAVCLKCEFRPIGL